MIVLLPRSADRWIAALPWTSWILMPTPASINNWAIFSFPYSAALWSAVASSSSVALTLMPYLLINRLATFSASNYEIRKFILTLNSKVLKSHHNKITETMHSCYMQRCTLMAVRSVYIRAILDEFLNDPFIVI